MRTPFGTRFFKDAEGRLVELPDEISDEEFYKTQAEVKAAEQQLGKGPAPKPVPPVDKQAGKKEPKKDKLKVSPKGRPGKGRAKAAAAAAAAAAGLAAVGKSKVALFLVGKAMPVLRKGGAMLAKLSANEQTHDDAAQKRQQSEQAVVIPDSENQAKSSGHQVSDVGGRPPPPVDESRGKNKLQESLSKNVPRKIEDVDNFKRDKKGQHIGADVMQVVSGDKNAVVTTFADMGQTPPPAPPEHTPEELPPMEVAPGTPAMNLGQGAVAPLQPEHTDVSNFTKQGDAKLNEEGVTQEQLDMVDSGELAEANKEKKGMEKAAKTEPLAIQTFAKQEATKIDTDLKQDEKKERGALTAKRKNQLGATGKRQKTAKTALEKKREEVAAKINGIYKAVQDKVTKKLADLETLSMKRFDEGNDKATKEFEDNVKRDISAFKSDRYSGFFGWARRARDWIKGIDDLPAVKEIFDRNRAAFVAKIDKLVADISADNKRVIQECKDDLAKAKKEIKDYVDKLGPALKDIGKQAAEEMNGKLGELDKTVAKKEEELQQKLADKQKAAIQAIDQKIEKMKEAMAGALAKLGKLLLWAAKKLFTWALKKFGYSLEEIQGIIDKGVAVLKAIFTKPIVFVKNLMKAAIEGFKNFGKNFLKHLKDALFEWLTGSLQGIKLPTTWDLKGIVGLGLQMVGISYDNLRRHMVTAMGEPVVAGLEKGFALVKTLITEGPMAAWEQLKDMAKDMQDAFIDAVKDYIKWKIIEEAIKWLVSLFIPGAGLIKAVIGIYDTVVFFIKKAKDIARMVANFLSSIGEIARGNIGAAAEAMEMGLARGLSLVISFLAALLRLTGVTSAIRKHIQKIRDKVDDVLAKVAKWVADKAKKLFGAVKTGAKKLLEWWKLKTAVQVNGKKLTLSTEGTEEAPQLLVAQSPGVPWSTYLSTLPPKVQATKPYTKATALAAKLEAKKKRITETDENKRAKASAAGAKEMQETLNELATQIKLLNAKSPDPASVITFGNVNSLGGGTNAEASILSKHHPQGTAPRDYAPIWENLADLGAGVPKRVRKDWYVQGHLLNENLGGPGMRFNLTPITKQANNKHKAEVETGVKKKVNDDGLVLYYSVTAKRAWGGSLKFTRLTQLEKKKKTDLTSKEESEIESLKALRNLTRGFECRAYELEQNSAGKWVKKKGGFEVPKTPIDNELLVGGDPYGY